MSFGDGHGCSEMGILRRIGSVIDTSAPSESVCVRHKRWNEGPRGRDKIVVLY